MFSVWLDPFFVANNSLYFVDLCFLEDLGQGVLGVGTAGHVQAVLSCRSPVPRQMFSSSPSLYPLHISGSSVHPTAVNKTISNIATFPTLSFHLTIAGLASWHLHRHYNYLLKPQGSLVMPYQLLRLSSKTTWTEFHLPWLVPRQPFIFLKGIFGGFTSRRHRLFIWELTWHKMHKC